MLDQAVRTVILELKERGLSIRKIARTLKVSRGAVRKVIEAGTAEVPPLDRAQKAELHHERIVELIDTCKGNLVRVHEELGAEGCRISYPALTAYCRRQQLGGHQPRRRSGSYHFEPGEEMQHDTSPHRVEIGGTWRLAQCASLVLCHSRMKYVQYYPHFDRFHCKVFLTDAVRYFEGCCARCMIDNTHVVVLRGTGKDMVPVPEMVALGEQLGGFVFAAHERGDANRSARVERPFHHVENNFLAGRSFSDWGDLNRRVLEWCERDNAKHRKRLHGSPRSLFAEERPRLKPLPAWVPEVYQLHHRIVGVEGYVTVHTNLYSVPYTVPVGRQVEVRETRDRIDVNEGPRVVASHAREWERRTKRVTDPTHRPRRRPKKRERSTEEEELLQEAPQLAGYVEQLKKRGRGSRTLALRQLLGMVRDFPREPLVAALKEAEHYGLFDLHRIESMVLKRIAGDYFRLADDPPEAPSE